MNTVKSFENQELNLYERNRIINSQIQTINSKRGLTESSQILSLVSLKAYVDPINGNSDVSNNCSMISIPCLNLGMVFNLFERFPNYVAEGTTSRLTIHLMNDVGQGQMNENCGMQVSYIFQKRIPEVIISTDTLLSSRKLVCGSNQEFLKSTNDGLPFVLEFFLLDLSNIKIFTSNITEIWTHYSNVNSCSFTSHRISFIYSNVLGAISIESSNLLVESSAIIDSFINFICSESVIMIKSSEFYNSVMNLDPQTLSVSRSLTIVNSQFYYSKLPNLKTFSNYFITSNRYGFDIYIRNSVFEGSGNDSDNVGAISVPHIYPFNLDVDGSTFRKLYSKEGGAAFYLSGYSRVIISHSMFDSNRALSMGGAIRMKGLSTRMTLLQCTFQNNQQITQQYAPSDSSKSSATNTLYGGGAIYFSQDSPSSTFFYSTIFRNNSAGGLGGAVLSYSGRSDEFVFVESEIVENRAGFYGGGLAILVNPVLSIYDEYVSIFELRKTKVVGNEAVIGGGLFFNNFDTITLDSESYLTNNIASKYSPALFFNKVNNLMNNAVSNNNYINDGSSIIQSPTNQFPTNITLFQNDKVTELDSSFEIVPGSTQKLYALFKDSNGNIANTSLLFNMQTYWKLSLVSIEGTIFVDDLDFYPSGNLLMIECKTSLLRRDVKGDSFSLRMRMDTKSTLQAFTEIQVFKTFNVTVGSCRSAEYIEQRLSNSGSDYFICSNRPSIIVGVTISTIFIGCIACIIMAIFTVKFCILYRDQRRKARKEKELEMKLRDFELNYTKIGETNASILSSQSASGIDYWMIKEEDIEIQQKIAEGGQGSVFKGKWKNKTQVAIKTFKFTLEEEAEASFQQEVALLRAVHHENIVAFYGVVIIETTRCMVTEFVPNNSLEYWISKMKKGEKKISLKEKFKILLDIAAAMSYLHELNPPIIHRDLKPGNVLLDNQMKAKICDLGVSKIVADHKVEKTNQIGTFNFMAIETFNGTEYNEKCDVFSFSIILWQMLFEENAVYSNELLKNKRVTYFMTDKDREVYEKLTPQNFNNYYIAKLISEGLRYPLPPLSKNLEDEKKLFVWVEEFMNNEGIDTARLTVKILPVYFSLIESCWRAEYNQRPSFTFIVKKLQELIEILEK